MRVSITLLAERIAAQDAAADNETCYACVDRADHGHYGLCVSCRAEMASLGL